MALLPVCLVKEKVFALMLLALMPGVPDPGADGLCLLFMLWPAKCLKPPGSWLMVSAGNMRNRREGTYKHVWGTEAEHSSLRAQKETPECTCYSVVVTYNMAKLYLFAIVFGNFFFLHFQ